MSFNVTLLCDLMLVSGLMPTRIWRSQRQKRTACLPKRKSGSSPGRNDVSFVRSWVGRDSSPYHRTLGTDLWVNGQTGGRLRRPERVNSGPLPAKSTTLNVALVRGGDSKKSYFLLYFERDWWGRSGCQVSVSCVDPQFSTEITQGCQGKEGRTSAVRLFSSAQQQILPQPRGLTAFVISTSFLHLPAYLWLDFPACFSYGKEMCSVCLEAAQLLRNLLPHVMWGHSLLPLPL
jgi:hypothetical protein